MLDFWQRYIGIQQCQFMINLYIFRVFTGLIRTKKSKNYFDWLDSHESELILTKEK
jgi:hypothetical protein